MTLLLAAWLLVAQPPAPRILVFCTISGCAPCEKLAPHVARLEGFTIETVKDDHAWFRAAGVTRFPTLILCAPDRTILKRHVGYMDAAQLKQWLR